MTRKPSGYFKGRKCCICGSDRTYINCSDTPVWSRCRCNRKDCTKFICHSCEHKRYEKESHNSLTNRRKRAQDCRIGNIDIDNERGKSILIEMVVAKVRKLENYNIKARSFYRS